MRSIQNANFNVLLNLLSFESFNQALSVYYESWRVFEDLKD